MSCTYSPASSIIDLNGGGHAGRKNDTGRSLIHMDADRDPLRQAHAGEDEVDGSAPLIVGRAFETLIARAMLSTWPRTI